MSSASYSAATTKKHFVSRNRKHDDAPPKDLVVPPKEQAAPIVVKPKKGINRTITLCIPSSVISDKNCKTQQQVASAAHQIARAATLYSVSEIIVYSASTDKSKATKNTQLLAGFLRYFVTPSYLRKSVFPNDISSYQVARKLSKLPRVPFLSHEPGSKYLQGLSVARKVEKKKGKNKRKKKAMRADEDMTGFVNIGEAEFLELSNGVKVPIHSSVIVDKEKKSVVGVVADIYAKPTPEDPIWTPGTFGYSVRQVDSFGSVFTECPYSDGYKYTAWVPCAQDTNNDGNDDDASISERSSAAAAAATAAEKQALSKISLIEDESFLKQGVPQSHPTGEGEDIAVLLVFGRWEDVSKAILADQESFAGLTEAEPLFDGRVRVSRATRIEDGALTVLGRIDGI